MEIKQYQIVLVRLVAATGDKSERKITCIVISPDEMNKYLRTVVVAPLNRDSTAYPTRPKVSHDNRTDRVVLDQIMTIEKERIAEAGEELSRAEIKKIKAVLKEIFID